MVLKSIKIGDVLVQLDSVMTLRQFLAFQGRMFSFKQEDLDFDSGDYGDYLFVTGSKPVHLWPELQGTGLMLAQLYRGPTHSALGTAVSTPTFNGAKVLTPELAVYSAPTVTSVGTAIGNGRRLFGFSQGVAQTTGSWGGEIPFTLAKNTEYLLRITTSDDSSAYELYAEFFEEDI